jgi:hypothetical protein
MLSKTNNNCLINIVAYDESGREVGKDLSEDYFVINKKSLLLIVSGAISRLPLFQPAAGTVFICLSGSEEVL